MDIRIEVRATRDLSEAELALIQRQRARIDYGMPHWGFQWAPKTWRVLVWLQDDVVSHAGLLERTVEVQGRQSGSAA